MKRGQEEADSQGGGQPNMVNNALSRQFCLGRFVETMKFEKDNNNNNNIIMDGKRIYILYIIFSCGWLTSFRKKLWPF